MVRLSQLTDPAAVVDAIEEWRQRGRAEFLLHYGFERSRDYFVRAGSDLVDSKPLVAVAYGRQHPERGVPTAAELSGGVKAAVAALRRLNFEVVTRAQLQPPGLGAQYADRTAVYEAFGGDKVAGVIRFPGDPIINVFSDEGGPYSDDVPSLVEPFGYRGEGFNGPPV